MSLKIKIFRDGIEIPIPKKSYEDSAVFDLTCPTTVTLIPRLCESIDIRIRMAIPQGFFGKIFSRSGLASQNSIFVLGGVIDSDYRGSIHVLLLNGGKDPYTISPGEKIAQIVILKKYDVEFECVDNRLELGLSMRGCRGFGSTSVKKNLNNATMKLTEFEEQKNESDDLEIKSMSCTLTVNDEKLIDEMFTNVEKE